MNVVFEVSIPVFGLGLLGYFATRLGYFSRDNADGLARFVYNFAVPLLLFRTLAHADHLGLLVRHTHATGCSEKIHHETALSSPSALEQVLPIAP